MLHHRAKPCQQRYFKCTNYIMPGPIISKGMKFWKSFALSVPLLCWCSAPPLHWCNQLQSQESHFQCSLTASTSLWRTWKELIWLLILLATFPLLKCLFMESLQGQNQWRIGSSFIPSALIQCWSLTYSLPPSSLPSLPDGKERKGRRERRKEGRKEERFLMFTGSFPQGNAMRKPTRSWKLLLFPLTFCPPVVILFPWNFLSLPQIPNMYTLLIMVWHNCLHKY